MSIFDPPMRFTGKAKRLDEWDYGRIAKRIGVGEDHIRAVVEVEAGGSGFDKYGRLKALFEPHRFAREVAPDKQTRAFEQGLAYWKWGTKPYPADSYPRIEAALKLDKVAALRSTSWGLGQIMGANHKSAGFRTPQDMIAAFVDDEEAHVQAMVNFIVAEGLDDDLRRQDWKGFARGYNGPGYAKNLYDVKLAAAFAKWSGKPDVAEPK